MASINSYRSRYSTAPAFDAESKKPPPATKTIPVKVESSSEEETEESSEEESSDEEKEEVVDKSPAGSSGTTGKVNGVHQEASSSSEEEDSSEEESSGEEEEREEAPVRRRPIATDMADGAADLVPWRRPKLRKVGRKSAVVQQSSSELPPWAEDAKRRLGDVPVALQKPSTVESRPEWTDKRVDVDLLEELERRHLEKIPVTPAQPEWTVPKLDAATIGRLERANRLDKVASFDTAPPDWADRRRSAVDLPALTPSRKAELERLRKSPRRRPDWSDMMREISGGPAGRLRHVECRDRSAPIIDNLQRRGDEFIFESEKKKNTSPTMKLMNDIKHGVKLKKVRCNDRSRPNLQGLRKLRRQRTSEAFLNLPPEELMDSEPEDLDDIDKVRDDLQSTRQLLGEEVKNRERLTKENRHLKAELKQVQEDLERSRLSGSTTPATKAVVVARELDADDLDADLGALEGEMAAMRDRAGESSQEANLWQERCMRAQQELAALQARLEEVEHGRQKGLKVSMSNGNDDDEVRRSRSSAKVSRSRTRDRVAKTTSQACLNRDETAKTTNRNETAKDETSSESESEEELDSEEERQREVDQERKKQTRELKMCESKVSHTQTKEKHARDERFHMKNRIKTLNQNLKDENRKHKELQREVKKMGAVLKDSDDEDGDQDSESEEESSEESESETETDESEESEQSESYDADLAFNEKMRIMQARAKRHEDNEKVIKKGNYMLKTTAERLFDQLRSAKEKYRTLERELNDLVNELQ